MIADNHFRTIVSEIEFTIFSIERSEAGLELLIHDARRAGSALADGNVNDGLHTLQSLIGHLYDFRRFIRKVSMIFDVDLAQIHDQHGSFADTADHFRATLHALSAALEEHNTEALSLLLSIDLVASLARFMEMLPLLRERIETDELGAA